MASLRFTAVIKIIGVNPYIDVSAARAAKLKPGWKKPLPVLVRINSKPEKPWRINMMPKGDGSFYLYLAEPVRDASGTKVGDKVTAEVSFDDKYKSGPMTMPAWIKAALDKNPAATQAWKALIPSRQKEILRYLTNLKSQEAKERNLEKTIRMLSGEKGRFMAREWKDGK
jgi:hypothetical protein